MKFKDSQNRFRSIKEFRGKFVYINILSITCGPCLRNIPFENSLVKRFTGLDTSVVFLNISADNFIGYYKKWKTFLLKHAVLGESFIVFDSTTSYKKHLASIKGLKSAGFPTYIVLDRNGNILGWDMDGPTSKFSITFMLSHFKFGTLPVESDERFVRELNKAINGQSDYLKKWVNSYFGFSWNDFMNEIYKR